jgi:hypothetical protein
MVKSFIILILTLLAIEVFANPPIEGYVEFHGNTKGNRPAYQDGNGPPTKYGLDFEFRIPVVEYHLFPVKLMLGADAFGAHSGFTRVAGRAGAYTTLPWFRNMEIGYYHRSEHNVDYANQNIPQRFLSDDYIFIRYNFGDQHR